MIPRMFQCSPGDRCMTSAADIHFCSLYICSCTLSTCPWRISLFLLAKGASTLQVVSDPRRPRAERDQRHWQRSWLDRSDQPLKTGFKKNKLKPIEDLKSRFLPMKAWSESYGKEKPRRSFLVQRIAKKFSLFHFRWRFWIFSVYVANQKQSHNLLIQMSRSITAWAYLSHVFRR